MTLKRFETFVIVTIIAAIGVVYAFTQAPTISKAPTTEQTAQTQSQSQNEQGVQQVPTTSITYEGVEGKTALELLKSSHQVQTKEFSGIGEFVESIDGLATDSKTNFWAFYVNGRQSPVGANAYVTKQGDLVEWKIETIDQ